MLSQGPNKAVVCKSNMEASRALFSFGCSKLLFAVSEQPEQNTAWELEKELRIQKSPHRLTLRAKSMWTPGKREKYMLTPPHSPAKSHLVKG